MIQCGKCGHENRSRWIGGDPIARCERCGALLESVVRTPSAESSAFSVHWGWIGGTLVGCVVALAYSDHALKQRWEAQQQKQAQEVAETTGLLAQREQQTLEQHQQRVQLIDAESANLLKDPDWISGERARRVREAEWARRLKQDPAFAESPLEQRLVEMERLGKDAQLSPQKALEQVARMAAPPGSRVEVLSHGDRNWVRIAFSMSALADRERGVATKHGTVAGMREEVRTLCAALIRDVLDFCGTRGIERVQVSCNRALHEAYVPTEATPEERQQLEARARVVIRRIYRLSLDPSKAQSVVDWRRVSLDQVLKFSQVELDGLSRVMIENLSKLSALQPDPNEPLEF